MANSVASEDEDGFRVARALDEDATRRRAASGDGGVDFAAPQAAYHTVLVVGAAGRVGTVLVRKLSLRGYAVKALVRSKEAAARCAPAPPRRMATSAR